MKVGTDGVLLGVWTNVDSVCRVLDVGCGSGLISLILSQRIGESADILAIDIDEGAIEQTMFNVSISRFDNINAQLISLQKVNESAKYDLIVSNPPFFKDSLHSPNSSRTIARHAETLGVQDIFEKADNLLADNGRLSLIYPADFESILLELADKFSLKTSRITHVKPTPDSDYKRILFECVKSPDKQHLEISELIIETERHIYSSDFVVLAKDFYLNL